VISDSKASSLVQVVLRMSLEAEIRNLRNNSRRKKTGNQMAERGGFEPPVPVLASTTV
jgi:hypothetical protein